jgi:hypothetical protein
MKTFEPCLRPEPSGQVECLCMTFIKDAEAQLPCSTKLSSLLKNQRLKS